MKKFSWCSVALAAAIFMSESAIAKSYAGTPAVRAFAERMAEAHGIAVEEVEGVLSQARKQQSILDAIARPAEKTKPWYEYRRIFLDEKRIEGGVEFWRQHADALRRAEQVYGVAPEIIVAIIGVETRYGKITGSYYVLDALATLGFDYPPRAAFFSKELEHFLLLAREQGQDPAQLKGSYAGAMGYGQFMPSSYRAYAADFDGDGQVDIWHNPVDAIGSVANYLKVHGWEAGEAVMLPAETTQQFDQSMLNKVRKPKHSIKELRAVGFSPVAENEQDLRKALPLKFEAEGGIEYWMGLQNFYTITRYNHSPLYARAVWELARAIQGRRQALAGVN